MRLRHALPVLLAMGCYFHKPEEPAEPGLDDQVASGVDGAHHIDGVPAKEGQRPIADSVPARRDTQPSVLLSGQVHYDGSRQGSLRVDAIRADATDPSAPPMLASTAVAPDGSWGLQVPRGIGTVELWAYLDMDDNGPSLGEPKGRLSDGPSVADAPISGLEIQVTDDWDQRHPATLTGLYLSPDSAGPPAAPARPTATP